MFAICEAREVVGSVISRYNGRDWWGGKRWTPAQDEAKLFDSREQAEAEAGEKSLRSHLIVEIND